MSFANPALDLKSINTIRGLSIDGVQKANSGHPGLPLGAAPMAYALWQNHLKHSPTEPQWSNRDRFILSAGHGSMLIYSLLHLTGYDLTIDDLKQFRQSHSRTPGHPENTMTAGVEMATGPLGQGFAHGVGMAIAEKHLAAVFNRPGFDVVDHYTYAIVSDGDLMEGISSEAGSLAGHLGLGKLIYLYDDNGISIDGSTELAFTENVEQRFEAFGWHVQRVDGLDPYAVSDAISKAKEVTDRPSLVMCKTIIGFGSPNKAGSQKSHGAPLGPDELKLTKEALGIPLEPDFFVADDVAVHMNAHEAGKTASAEWNKLFTQYQAEYPELAAELSRRLSGTFNLDWNTVLPTFAESISSRKAGEKALNAAGAVLHEILGGSADLAESNFTHLHGVESFQRTTPTGRNVNYGVREHAMAAAANGMQLHGGVRPIAASFLQFTDYCRSSIRLAALMECPTIFVFTHDSIGLGEDGPTHQPVEHFAALRAMPNLNMIRPCDGNETSAAYKVALESTHTPTLLALSRQNLAPVTPSDIANHPLHQGGYVLKEASGDLKVVLVATGSEVQVTLAAAEKLESEGIATRVVSLPSWFLFEKQTPEYRNSVLPKSVPTVSVEAGASLGWHKYSHAQVAIDRFGVSGPANEIFAEFGFTAENIALVAKGLL